MINTPLIYERGRQKFEIKICNNRRLINFYINPDLNWELFQTYQGYNQAFYIIRYDTVINLLKESEYFEIELVDNGNWYKLTLTSEVELMII